MDRVFFFFIGGLSALSIAAFEGHWFQWVTIGIFGLLVLAAAWGDING